MRHRIDDVVDREAVSERSHRHGIYRVVRVLPRVAHVHVEVDRDDQAPLVVVNSVPLGRTV